MVFKLNQLKKQVQNKEALDRATQRPFDVQAQLAALNEDDHKNLSAVPADYATSLREKRINIINRVAIPQNILRFWIQQELAFIGSQPASSSDLSERFRYINSLADLLIGSEASIAIDFSLMQFIGQIDDSNSAVSTSETKESSDINNNLGNDDDENENDNGSSNNNANRKFIAVAGRKLFDAFNAARRRNANHYLGNKDIFSAWRTTIEEFKATEDNCDELEDVMRASYKLQMLNVPCAATVLQDVLEEYKDFDLDADKKFHLVHQVQDRYGSLIETGESNKNNNSSNANNNKKLGKAEEKIQFLNQLREKAEVTLLETIENPREFYNACKAYAEIERREKPPSSAGKGKYNNNQSNNASGGNHWLERSVYVLMRGLLMCEEKASSSYQQQQKQRDYAEVGFDLLAEIVQTLFNFLGEEHATTPFNTVQHLLQPSMMIYPISGIAEFAARHFELLYYFAFLSSADDSNKNNNETDGNDERKSIWCKRRLRILEITSIFFLVSPLPPSDSNLYKFLAVFTEHINFATDELEAKPYIVSRALLQLNWYYVNKCMFGAMSSPIEQSHRAFSICSNAIENEDESIEDFETTILLPTIYQVLVGLKTSASPVMIAGSPQFSVSLKTMKTHLALADDYLREKKLPLQSFTMILSAMTLVAANSPQFPDSYYLLVGLKWNLEERYRKAVLSQQQEPAMIVKNVESTTVNKQSTSNVEETSSSEVNNNNNRRRERTNDIINQDNTSLTATTSTSTTRKFFIYKFPKDKTEKEIVDALLSVAPTCRPTSVDFIRPKRAGAGAVTTVTVVISFNTSDVDAPAVEKMKVTHSGEEYLVPKFLTEGFVNMFPGTHVSGEKSSTLSSVKSGTSGPSMNNKTAPKTQQTHQAPAPPQQSTSKSQPSGDSASQPLTNDDFAKLLG